MFSQTPFNFSAFAFLSKISPLKDVIDEISLIIITFKAVFYPRHHRYEQL